MEQRKKTIWNRQYLITLEILREKKNVLEKAAKLLLENEKMDGEELKTLMDETSSNFRHGWARHPRLDHMAFQVKINYLRGGTSAPQNLQGTVCLLLLAGTTWSRIHLGHVRLRCKIVLITAKKGFISLPLSLSDYGIILSPERSSPVVQAQKDHRPWSHSSHKPPDDIFRNKIFCHNPDGNFHGCLKILRNNFVGL